MKNWLLELLSTWNLERPLQAISSSLEELVFVVGHFTRSSVFTLNDTV